MKKLSTFLIICLLMVCPLVNVQAETIEHFYTQSGNNIEMQDDAQASVALVGTNIEVSSQISGVSAAVGNNVTFSGTSDYLALVGNSVELNGVVNNDAFVAGVLIESSAEAEYNRDVIMAGSEVTLSGKFARNVSIYATTVTITQAEIAGNIKIQANNIIIESGTIEGQLSYPEDANVTINDEATVNDVVQTEPINNQTNESYLNTIYSKTWSFACYALIFAIMCLLLPKVITRISDKYEKVEPGVIVELFTKGLIMLIVVPLICILLFMTVIGLPLGVVGLVLYGVAFYLSTIFTAYFLGYKIWQKIFKKDMNMLIIGLIGLFILLILNIIPGINYLVAIITIVVGLGLIFDNIQSSR